MSISSQDHHHEARSSGANGELLQPASGGGGGGFLSGGMELAAARNSHGSAGGTSHDIVGGASHEPAPQADGRRIKGSVAGASPFVQAATANGSQRSGSSGRSGSRSGQAASADGMSAWQRALSRQLSLDSSLQGAPSGQPSLSSPAPALQPDARCHSAHRSLPAPGASQQPPALGEWVQQPFGAAAAPVDSRQQPADEAALAAAIHEGPQPAAEARAAAAAAAGADGSECKVDSPPPPPWAGDIGKHPQQGASAAVAAAASASVPVSGTGRPHASAAGGRAMPPIALPPAAPPAADASQKPQLSPVEQEIVPPPAPPAAAASAQEPQLSPAEQEAERYGKDGDGVDSKAAVAAAEEAQVIWARVKGFPFWPVGGTHEGCRERLRHLLNG